MYHLLHLGQAIGMVDKTFCSLNRFCFQERIISPLWDKGAGFRFDKPLVTLQNPDIQVINDYVVNLFIRLLHN